MVNNSHGKRMVREDQIKQIGQNAADIKAIKGDLAQEVKFYEVTDITAIDGEILTKLKAGDVVLKKTGEQYHSYRVSFKKADEGMCLTYTDAANVETVSYDLIEGTWTYNSTDKTSLEGCNWARDEYQKEFNLFDTNAIVRSNGFYDTTGSFISNSNYNVRGFYLKAGKYTLSGNNLYMGISIMNSSYVWQSSVTLQQTNSYTFTLESDSYVGISVQESSVGVSCMLNEGTTALPYQPFYGEVVRTKQVPPAPTANGSYVLTVTVSSGVATYSWEAAPANNNRALEASENEEEEIIPEPVEEEPKEAKTTRKTKTDVVE